MATNELIGALVVLLGVAILFGVEIMLIADFAYEKITGKRRAGISRRIRIPWTLLSVIGLGCLLHAHFIAPFDFGATHITIHTTKLPPGFRMRIAHISDLHLEGDAKTPDWIARTVREKKPDIIALTGDYVNNRQAGMQAFVELLEQLDAPHILAVKGNYDSLQPATINSKVTALEGYRYIADLDGQRISFFGCDITTTETFSNLISRVPEEDYNVVLYHMPDMIDPASQHGADLFLCGHTHGGQVRMPFYGAVITLSPTGKKYEMGMYRVRNTTAYVSRGLGCEGGNAPRLRFLCRPEIAILDIVGE